MSILSRWHRTNPEHEPAGHPNAELIQSDQEATLETADPQTRVANGLSELLGTELETIDSAEDFVSSVEPQLAHSEATWGLVARTVKTYRHNIDESAIRAEHQRFYNVEGMVVSEQTAQKNIDNAVTRFTMDLLQTSRLIGAGLNDPRLRIHNAATEQRLVSSEMREADRTAYDVLNNLLNQSPTILPELAELFKDGVEQSDPRFAELQKIINSDWYRPNGTSILRDYIASRKLDSSAYADSFAETVASEEKSKQLIEIQQMAKLAVIAKDPQVEITTEQIQETLLATANRWNEIPAIYDAFKKFSHKKAEQEEHMIQAIAGIKRPKSIRQMITLDEVNTLMRNGTAVFLYEGNREDRRNASKQPGGKRIGKKLDEFGSIDELMRVADQSIIEERYEKHGLAIAKLLQNNQLGLEDIDPNDVAEHFKMLGTPAIREDIAKIMEWLRIHPIGPGSRNYKDRKISFEGTRFKVKRFAPNECKKLSINGVNRYLRVLYVPTPKTVAILDVLSHEDYNNS